MFVGPLTRDIRYALRTARRHPGGAIAAFLALALGIGATTAIFSVVNAVILRPLPVVDEGSLVRIFASDARSDKDVFSMTDFLDWKKQLKSFSGLALFHVDQANLTGQGPPERLLICQCDSAMLPVLGVSPVAGRNFYGEEDQPGRGAVAMLSWAFWESHFAGQDVIGRKIILDEQPYTVVGILPRDVGVLRDAGVWVPVTFDLKNLINTHPYRRYGAFGRLRRGVSLAQANADLRAVAASVAAQYEARKAGVSARAVTLRDSIAGDVRPGLLMLLGAGMCVLLIGCGNVANLALVRAFGRQREISVRLALGASRATILRQLFTEDVLLSLGAASAGVGLAAGALKILRSLPRTRIPNPQEITLDGRVLLFAIAMGVLTAIAFGLAPAIRITVIRVHDSIRQTSGRMTESKAQQRLRTLFVFVETAVAALLVIQSGLLIKSYAKASHINPGFEADHLLTVHVSLPPLRYSYEHPGSVASFARQLLPKIRSIPGVESAALTSDLPLSGTGGGAGILIEGQPRPKNIEDSPFVQWTRVTPGYFRTMNIRLLRGRDVNERDNANAPDVAVVNQTFAKRFFPGKSAIGKRLSPPLNRPEWTEIVGVVADVPQLGMERRAIPEIFYPLPQAEVPWLAMSLRTSGDPLSYSSAVRRAVQEVDPGVAVFLPRSMDDIIRGQLGWRVFQTSLVGVFGAIAIVLAAIGIYAVVAYSVTQRVREIGIRMALGAQKRQILRVVLREGAIPAFLGALAGALCSLALSNLLSQLLYGIESTDLPTYLIVISLFLAIAVVASYLPSRRAAELDPARALRYE